MTWASPAPCALARTARSCGWSSTEAEPAPSLPGPDRASGDMPRRRSTSAGTPSLSIPSTTLWPAPCSISVGAVPVSDSLAVLHVSQ